MRVRGGVDRYRILICSILLAGICVAVTGCGRKQEVSLDPASLLKVAQDYGKAKQSVAVVSAAPKRGEPSAASLPTEAEYVQQIRSLFNDWNWDQLEKAAHDARTSKARVLGGGWKLYMFYDAVTAPPEPASGTTTDSDWTNHIEALKQWAATKPESATALIAQAFAYYSFGLEARGGGYADTVTPEGWKLLEERNEKAAALLVEASRRIEKCPFWYEVMQDVALQQGWTKEQELQLLNAAIQFEPDFYHFYREHANYLLPKWYGEEGETQAFAEEISARVGGQQGEFLYFEIGSMLACQCDPNRNTLEGLSWPRLKEGYTALGELYGVSNMKANRFAMMAYLEKDKAAAQPAFEKIGNNWEDRVWRKRQDFDDAKAWAMSP